MKTKHSGRTLFTADTHFGHENIIRLCDRPFRDGNEMRETLIANWNAVVGPDDTIYHLGDFAWLKDRAEMERLIKRLNGRKILIAGNHDLKLLPLLREFFEEVHDHRLELSVDGLTLILDHYPLLEWGRFFRGSIHLHGHCHGRLSVNRHGYRIDVGVDAWNFTPVSLAQIKGEIGRREFDPAKYFGVASHPKYMGEEEL